MDLIAIAVITAAAAPLLALVGLPQAARLPLALPLVLFFPGYSLVAAVFPKRRWPEAPQRLALSAAASLAVVALVGIALNYSPWGLRERPVLAFIGLFIFLACLLGLLHRQALPAEERLDVGPGVIAAWASRNLPQLAYPVAAVLGALVAVSVVLFLAPGLGPRQLGEPFTEFYLLSSDGSSATYRAALTAGQPAAVTFGIVNREGREAQYTVSLLVNDSPLREYGPIRLAPGQRLERSLSFRLTQAGEGQVVRLVLHKDERSLPYRSLYLRVDGLPAPVAREAALAGGPESAPRPPSPAAPEPSPPLHVVSRGENLTLIARYYGLPLSALLAANELPDPDLIYPDQPINLPPASGTGTE